MMVEKRAARGGSADLKQLETREEEGNDDGGEDFEESFDPEVNDPPAPVFGGDEMAALTVHEAGGIEERNGDAGDEEEDEQGAVFTLADEGRLEELRPSGQARGRAR